MASGTPFRMDVSPPGSSTSTASTSSSPNVNEVVYVPKINPEKLPAVEILQKIEEENHCLICTEPLSLNDDHHVVTLKCGHIFGKSCIENWLRPANKTLRCPTCAQKATKKDIIRLWATCIRPVDPKQLRILNDQIAALHYEKAHIDQNRMRLENDLQIANIEIERVKLELSYFQSRMPTPGSKRPLMGKTMHNPLREHIETIEIEMPRFTLKHLIDIEIRDSKARCHSFSQLRESLFASVASTPNSLFPNTRYGIKRIPLEANGRSETFYIHEKIVRDMFIDERQNSALTVSSDKTLKISSLIGNQLISSVDLSCEAFSVHMNTEQLPDLIYVGLKNGELQVFDQRNLAQPIESMVTTNKLPITSLQSLPGYGDNEKNRSFILAVHMANAQLFHMNNMQSVNDERYYEAIKIPYEGKLSNASYDRQSNRIMLSLRASSKNQCSYHYIFNYDKGTFAMPNLLTRLAGSYEGAIMARSKLFSHPAHDDYVIAAANGPTPRTVRFWNVDDQSNWYDVHTREDTRDIEFINQPTRPLISCLSEQVVKLYSLE